ncbi:MAG: protein kinase [Planctomycetes bacterium]|nr:protein kinase [Planctomycetota bacterium]
MLAEVYVLSGRDAGKVVDTGAGPMIFLGRAASNTFRLRDPQMSRVHCRIEVTTEGLTLSDAESGNGTWVNGDRLEGPRLLEDGDEISIGATKLKVLVETEEDRELYRTRIGGDLLESSGSLEVSNTAQRAIGSDAPEKPRAGRRAGRQDQPVANKLREVIPGFRLEARLGGKSRQGIAVYRAIQRSLDRSVALKVFLPRGQTRPEDVRRFVREAKAVARVPRPNVVTIHDIISHAKLRAIVFEFIGGGSLEDQLEDGPLGLEETLNLGSCVARALAHLHSHGVLHRGIKPEHILFGQDFETYKLGNFGNATGPGGQRSGETTYLDAPLKGLAYLSPEQLTNADVVSPASDVYSIGACLHAAFNGQPPFEGDSVPILAASVLRDTAPPLPAEVPQDFQAVIFRCLEKEPGDRYADGVELLAAIDEVEGSP